MKKLLKSILTIIMVVIVLACLTGKIDMLGLSAFRVTEEQLESYSNYYYNQLDEDEKKIYIKIDTAIKDKKTDANIGSVDIQNINDIVSKVLTAYFYDNPEYYYISNQYKISTTDLKLFNYSTVSFNYLIPTKEEIELKNNKLEREIEEIIADNINDGMSDFEKELALHDALVNHVDYYEYEDINLIPAIKHTAYGALVEKEAVCDGYSKAYKLLLEKVGIETIVVGGTTEDTAHAWNMVRLEDGYYNVDVTSDKLINKSKKHVVHTYFNLTDEQISKTHNLDKDFKLPECVATLYNYYTYNDLYLDYEDNTYVKLKQIIQKQRSLSLLEFEANDKYKSKTIIDTLYDLNFNNWKSSGKTSVEYSKIRDIYLFVK